jgi:hypothetical protein
MNALFSCREASRLASEALDHPLAVGQRMTLRMHLLMCAACRAYERQIHFIDRTFRLRARGGNPYLPIGDGLDPAARERIRAKLKKR